MSLNLYFKTDEFKSNKSLASYFYSELCKEGFHVEEPQSEDFMYSMQASIDGQEVFIYVGKNDEESTPCLWQVWPEQKVPILKCIFGTPDKAPEEKAKLILEKIVYQIKGVSGVEWSI